MLRPGRGPRGVGPGAVARLFEGNDADGAAGHGVEEGDRHLAVVHMFQGAPSELTACGRLDGVGGAAGDLDVGDEPLGALTVLDAELRAADDGHPHAEGQAGHR